MTLAIAGLVAGGSFTWYSSQRSAQFYDGARQVESQLKDIQTSITANELPEGAPFPTPNGSIRPLIFATAATVDSADGNNRQLTIQYLSARYDADTNLINPIDTSAYDTRQVFLPDGMIYHGVAVDNTLGCPQDINAWDTTTLTYDSGVQTVAFRREPLVINHFAGGSVSSSFTEWGGDSPAAGSVTSLPCAVAWQFWSQEGADTNNPRFRAEIVFNIKNATMRLVTH